MTYYVAFDVSHKPRGKIDDNLTNLRDHLNSNDLICYNFLETPITYESLRPYDILVFVCPDFAKISRQEIVDIVSWVKEDGGGLLLLSHAGGDRGRNSNLSEISEQFGIIFENDQVLDEEKNLGLENLPIISNFMPPHPITEGIDSICYRAGCSLTIIGSGAISIASSNESSEPFSCPLICVAEEGNGRICCIGSYEMFRDNTGGGFQQDTHPQLAQNIFNWLISDYRADLRSGGSEVEQPAPEGAGDSAMSGGQESMGYPASTGGLEDQDIDFAIKISSKSELMVILKVFLQNINTMKTTIESLIEKAEASEDEIFELRNLQDAAKSPEAQTVSPEPNSSEQEEQVEESFDFSIPEESPSLSALPPKPPTLLKGVPAARMTEETKVKEEETEENLEIPQINEKEEKEEDAKTKEKTEKKKKEEPKEPEKPDIEELEAEKDSLQSKLNSVNNLTSFIKKKHDNGKMDDKAFNKQMKKLQKDIDKTEKRLKEIDNLLGE